MIVFIGFFGVGYLIFFDVLCSDLLLLVEVEGFVQFFGEDFLDRDIDLLRLWQVVV